MLYVSFKKKKKSYYVRKDSLILNKLSIKIFFMPIILLVRSSSTSKASLYVLVGYSRDGKGSLSYRRIFLHVSILVPVNCRIASRASADLFSCRVYLMAFLIR